MWLGAKTQLRQLILISGGLGMCLGALNLLGVAFCGHHHHIASVAWVEAALAVSSVAGGLAYGARRWQVSRHMRLTVLVSAVGLCVALAGQSPDIAVLVAVAGFTGLFVSPALTTAYLIADEAAARNARTEAGAWVNTAYNAGNSAGTAGIGLLVDRLPLAACFAIAAATALFPATIAAVTVGRRRTAVASAGR
jgi:predicted MFS family arabinose efflux permease